ncbi:MAG: arginine--tRNA ligase [Ignavibacteriales bacterium]|nr:arginine--tRNA ligase [Ignavibacteriales bacterium]
MKEYLEPQIKTACGRTFGAELNSRNIPIAFEKPKVAEHGDIATNIAMQLSKTFKKNPRQIATEIVAQLQFDSSIVEKVEIAGPGFINFHFTKNYFQNELKTILEIEKSFGKSFANKGKKAQVEFVSANPTGPLTVGHGRNAVFGDTVARLLEWSGYDVTREYYFNNAGRQMRVLGDSVRLRYLELIDEKIRFPQFSNNDASNFANALSVGEIPFPEDYYQGEYITDIAKSLHTQFGDSLRNENAEGKFKQQAESEIFEDIKKTCKRLGIAFDVFFNENTLYETGMVKEVIEEFKQRGVAYESEGALWLKKEILGSEKDKVIVKSTGEPTYRLPDIAYHREKIRRGFDLMIDILGSDHIATYPDVIAGLNALGENEGANKIKVLIHQFVTILQDGEVVKMSTRKANYITLDELMDEVGADVVRYFFLMRSIGSHLNFDLKLAKEQSDENPVYYLQYAHARIASIIRFAAESQEPRPKSQTVDFSMLKEEAEISLIKMLRTFPEIVENVATNFEPHLLCEYLHEVAGVFHKFYHDHRVVTDNKELTSARLDLCSGAKIVLGNGLAILGITAPEKM